MTVISILTAADVAALKCIYFQLVKSLKEIDWYGINCNVEDYITDTELAFTYLELINTGCTRTHPLECEIKTFITKKSSFCVFTDTKCQSKYTIITIEVQLLAENSNPIMTEQPNNIII